MESCTGTKNLDPSSIKSFACPDCEISISHSKLKQHQGKSKCLRRQKIMKERTEAQVLAATATSSMSSLRISSSSNANSTGIYLCPYCKEGKSSPQALGSHKKFCKVGSQEILRYSALSDKENGHIRLGALHFCVYYISACTSIAIEKQLVEANISSTQHKQLQKE